MTQLALNSSSFSVRLLTQSLTQQDDGSNAARIATVQGAVVYPFNAPDGWIRQRAASHWDRAVSQAQIVPVAVETISESHRDMIDDDAIRAFRKSTMVAVVGFGLSLAGEPFGWAILPTIGAAMVAVGCLLAAGVVEKSRDGG